MARTRYQKPYTYEAGTVLVAGYMLWIMFAVSSACAATNPRKAVVPAPSDPDTCRHAAQTVERAHRLPRMILSTIALVETGKWVRATGENIAWPWTINAQGKSHHYPTKQAAVDAVHRLQAQGLRSIDVGCMQINLRYHPEAFMSLEDAFDPHINISYAAKFLVDLRRQVRSWNTAIGYYHSRTRAHYVPYQRKVQRLWQAERRRVALERRAKRREAALRPARDH